VQLKFTARLKLEKNPEIAIMQTLGSGLARGIIFLFVAFALKKKGVNEQRGGDNEKRND
jgi:hypothetical protein